MTPRTHRPATRRTLSRAPDPRKPLGDFGERVAAARLEAKGYALLDRNFRVAEAEIDIVARDGDTLVFVEVRTRRGGEAGVAALSVNAKKAQQLRHAAAWYVEEHPQLADAPMRIDVVTVELRRDGTLAKVTHIEHAVRG
jgi:putative endonuclease